MPDHRKWLLIAVVALTAWFLIDYLFVRTHLPDYIPDTPIRISGLFIFIGIMATHHFSFKKILKDNPETSFSYLVIFGGLMGLLSELLFQTYRVYTFEDETSQGKVWLLCSSVFMSTLMITCIAVSIAIDQKYKKRWLGTLVLFGCFFLIKYAGEYFGIVTS